MYRKPISEIKATVIDIANELSDNGEKEKSDYLYEIVDRVENLEDEIKELNRTISDLWNGDYRYE